MAYDIYKQLIPGLPHNSYRHGKPEGIVLHEVGYYGGTAEGNRKYEASHWKSAFVHFFVDWDSIIQCADTDYLAYGAGHVANQRFIHIELVRTKDKAQFERSYNRYVWLIARLLKQYGLKPDRRTTLWTHKDVTKYLGGTTHQDPDAYLATYGVSVDELIADITSAYNGSDKPVSKPQNAPKPASNPKTSKSSNLLCKGDKGNAVKELQQDLIKAGYSCGNAGADGDFGSGTEKAVKELQHDYHISVDGVVGDQARAALKKALSNKKSKPKSSSKSSVPYPGHLIKVGSRGKDVQRVQNAVNVKADGDFGPATKKAVQAYQRHHGLTADGIVGKKTWGVMF